MFDICAHGQSGCLLSGPISWNLISILLIWNMKQSARGLHTVCPISSVCRTCFVFFNNYIGLHFICSVSDLSSNKHFRIFITKSQNLTDIDHKWLLNLISSIENFYIEYRCGMFDMTFGIFCHCLGEIGGYMGLLIGASVLSVCEVLDLFLYNMLVKLFDRRAAQRKVSTSGITYRSSTTLSVQPYTVKMWNYSELLVLYAHNIINFLEIHNLFPHILKYRI